MMIDKLVDLIVRETGADPKDIKLSTRLDLLVADSLEFVSLVVEINHEFNVNIPNDKLTQMQTVLDVLDALKAAGA